MLKKQKCIVTITDGISPTSMPFNEFILYRLKHYPEEKQILIQLFEHGMDKNIQLPKDVTMYSLGINIKKINSIIRRIEKEYDVVAYHVHEGKSVILFSVATLWRYRNKTIYTLHSTFKNYPFHNKLFSFCASLLARDVVCVSKTSLKYYPKILKFIRGKHAMCIQNGVDMERINAVTSFTPNDKSFTIIYVARLVALKRHYMLFEMLKELPDVKLKLIGKGPLEVYLVNMVKEMHLETQVEFLGLLPREEVYKRLKEANLYISTSSYEGLPIGVLEAMGCGISCLVSDIEQHVEIANVCSSLQLCNDDITTWVKRINEIKELPALERQHIGMNNRKDVFKSFSLASMHSKYDELYYVR